MNEEFKNGNGLNEENEAAAPEATEDVQAEVKPEPEIIEETPEIQPEPVEPAEQVTEEVPDIDTRDVSSYSEPQQQEPVSGYSYGSYNQNGSSYSQPEDSYYNPQSSNGYNYNQGYAPYQPVQTPPQPPKKSNRGLKIFAICICALLAISIGVCAFVISRYVVNPEKSEVNTTEQNEILNEGAPDLETGETPESSVEIPSSGPLTAAQAYAKASASNVGIVVYTKNSTTSAGEGTGVIMGEDEAGEYTYIVTCAHVISDSGISVSVQTEDGTTYDAEIVGFDTRTDLGVIKIKASGLPKAEFGDSTKLNVGDTVYAIGNPGGVEFFGSFTSGSVSAIDRPVSSEIGYTMTCIQHDAAINPGNSGGMLINIYGQVIGINSQKIAATDYEGMGFAIPITDAMPIINNLIDYGYVPNRPKLGITYYSLSASAQYSMIAQINGLPAGTLIIDEIDSESSLAGTGAQQYDMIIAVNGKDMTSADVLLELIDGGAVGDKLTLTLARINRDYTVSTFDIEVTLVEDKSTPETETTEEYYYVDPFGGNGYEYYFGY